jgi:hypothetical protein
LNRAVGFPGSKQMAESMTEKQLRDFAKTERKKLPTQKRRKS